MEGRGDLGVEAAGGSRRWRNHSARVGNGGSKQFWQGSTAIVASVLSDFGEGEADRLL